MRAKGEILSKVLDNIGEAPIDTRCMLYHEYILAEVLIDIRDILSQLLRRPNNNTDPRKT